MLEALIYKKTDRLKLASTSAIVLIQNITLALLGSIAIRYLSLGCSTWISSDPSGYLNLNGLENCMMLGSYCSFIAYRHNNIIIRLYIRNLYCMDDWIPLYKLEDDKEHRK